MHTPKDSTPKKRKAKSGTQQLKLILEQTSHTELKEFILAQSKADKLFKYLVITNFAHHNKNQSKEFYIEQISTIVKAATNRYGLIDRCDLNIIEDYIRPVLAIATKHFEAQNFTTVFYICTAIMEQLSAAEQYSDDNSWTIGSMIHKASEILEDMTLAELPANLKMEFINYCITAFENRIFHDWDWHIAIINIAYQLVDNEEEAEIVIECLNKVDDESYLETTEVLKLNLLSEYKDQETVIDFVDKHLSNTEIRDNEINKALNNKEVDKAIKLCEDGINLDKDRAELVNKWKDWLLKIAQMQNNSDKIIEYARHLLTHQNLFNKEYYNILKKEIGTDKWLPYLEDIITEVSKPEINTSSPLMLDLFIPEVFIHEQLWDKLLAYLKQHSYLDKIEKHKPYLVADYSSELIVIYSDELVKYLDQNVGRGHYKKACRHLKIMRGIGDEGKAQAKVLINTFKTRYPKRRALINELNYL